IGDKVFSVPWMESKIKQPAQGEPAVSFGYGVAQGNFKKNVLARLVTSNGYCVGSGVFKGNQTADISNGVAAAERRLTFQNDFLFTHGTHPAQTGFAMVGTDQ
ncbi:MAG: hypothetical protein GWM98_21065, partial [Nitrospinaceae bacterium]|nr:hypothetical protein [Nitrospinaceae bacterium]